MKIYENIIPIINQNLNEEHLKLYLYWIIERYNIHLLKDVQKKPYPWTSDDILKTYSFTNVRRIQDTVTKFVLNQICFNSELNLREKIINIILFRIFNEPTSYKLLKLPIKQNLIQNQNFYDFLNYHTQNITSNTILYRTAYMHSGVCKSYDQISQSISSNLRPFYMIWKAYKQNKIENIEQFILKNEKNKVYNQILSIKGIGDFLAYQIYIDLTYCPQTKLTENDFVYLGQGALSGINIVCPNIPRSKRYMFVYYIQDNIEKFLKKYYNIDLKHLMWDLPEEQRFLSLSNIQNCFCEFSKYFRFKYSTKPLKRRFYKVKK